MLHRFGANGLYILDEPEAALSTQNCLTFLAPVEQLVHDGSQLIVATHSPLMLGYPDALIYECDEYGLQPIAYDDAEPVRLTRCSSALRSSFCATCWTRSCAAPAIRRTSTGACRGLLALLLLPRRSRARNMLRSVWSSSEIDGLRQLLMEHWDPIGVHAFAEADDDRSSYWDEYDGYMPAILKTPQPSIAARRPLRRRCALHRRWIGHGSLRRGGGRD
jgi:hypothetical protein